MDHQDPAQSQNPFTQLPDNVVSKIMENLPHHDMTRAATVDRRFGAIARETSVEGEGLPLRCLNTIMQGHRLVGYHGTSAQNAPEMYERIDASKFGQNWGTSELGPGLYTIPVPRPPAAVTSTHKKMAQTLATGWAPTGSATVALPVMARGLDEAQIHKMGPSDPRYWATVERQANLPPLPYVTSHDAVEDPPVVQGLPPKQLKLNPHAIDGSQANRLSIQVAPPASPDGRLGPDFLVAMLMKYADQHPDDPIFQ